jgi:hypothetical protein
MKTKNQKYPLRKIVALQTRYVTLDGFPFERKYELLECGHLGKYLAVLDYDMYGSKSALKRRCRECVSESNKK